MIVCRDCKYFLELNTRRKYCRKHDDYTYQVDEYGCSFAERADGLTVCCETCKHNWPDSAGPYCHEGNWHHNNREDFRYDKMKCDEWEAK